MNPSICHPSIYPSVHASIHLYSSPFTSILSFIHPPIHLFIHPFICPFIYPPTFCCLGWSLFWTVPVPCVRLTLRELQRPCCPGEARPYVPSLGCFEHPDPTSKLYETSEHPGTEGCSLPPALHPPPNHMPTGTPNIPKLKYPSVLGESFQRLRAKTSLTPGPTTGIASCPLVAPKGPEPSCK